MMMFLTVVVVFGFIGLWSIVFGSVANEVKKGSKNQTQEQKIENNENVIKWGAILALCIWVIYYGLTNW